jgi:hypothetical protein
MATLHIALHDGFAGDTVAIGLDGREVYSKAGVRTDLRISRADSVDVEAPDGQATVEVRARGRTAAATVDPSRTPYVAVDLGPDGQPGIRATTEPFAYL